MRQLGSLDRRGRLINQGLAHPDNNNILIHQRAIDRASPNHQNEAQQHFGLPGDSQCPQSIPCQMRFDRAPSVSALFINDRWRLVGEVVTVDNDAPWGPVFVGWSVSAGLWLYRAVHFSKL